MRILAAVFLVLCLGCSSKNDASTFGGRPSAKPREYFPVAVGTTWIYAVTIGPGEPLMFSIREWPIGERALVQSVRSRFLGTLKRDGQAPGQMQLQFRIVGPTDDCPLATGRAVKLEIQKDDLGVFDGCKDVYFTSIGEEALAEWVLVTTYDRMGMGAPSGSWGSPLASGDGYSFRLFFFGHGPGVQIALGGGETGDRMICMGAEKVRRGARSVELVHFVRSVDAKEIDEAAETDVLDSGFTEDLWFERGRGLVRLEQTVNGQRSMTWELSSVQ